MDMDSVTEMSDVVLSACTLHNCCILGDDNLEDFMTETEACVPPINGEDGDNDGRLHVDIEGRQKRLAVADELWNEA